MESGLADATEEEAQIKRSMVAAAREVIAIVDHTKWERAAFATFCPTDQITIASSTDAGAPAAMVGDAARPRHRGPARRPRTCDRRRRDRGRRDRADSPMTGRGDDVRPGDDRRRAAAPPRAELRGISKRFGATQALDDVSLDAAAGRGPRPRRRERRRQEHAGQDPGRRPPARQRRRSCSTASRSQIHGPAQARALGIAVVHQEPRLFPDLTVAENVFIGHAPSGRARLDRLGRDAPRGRRRCSRSSTSSSTSTRRSAACRWPTSS